MIDNKVKYTIELGDGRSEEWTEDMWNKSGAKLQEKYPEAAIRRVSAYDPNDEQPGDFYDITLADGRKESWNSSQWNKSGAKLREKYPDAQVSVRRYIYADVPEEYEPVPGLNDDAVIDTVARQNQARMETLQGVAPKTETAPEESLEGQSQGITPNTWNPAGTFARADQPSEDVTVAHPGVDRLPEYEGPLPSETVGDAREAMKEYFKGAGYNRAFAENYNARANGITPEERAMTMNERDYYRTLAVQENLQRQLDDVLAEEKAHRFDLNAANNAGAAMSVMATRQSLGRKQKDLEDRIAKVQEQIASNPYFQDWKKRTYDTAATIAEASASAYRDLAEKALAANPEAYRMGQAPGAVAGITSYMSPTEYALSAEGARDDYWNYNMAELLSRETIDLFNATKKGQALGKGDGLRTFWDGIRDTGDKKEFWLSMMKVPEYSALTNLHKKVNDLWGSYSNIKADDVPQILEEKLSESEKALLRAFLTNTDAQQLNGKTHWLYNAGATTAESAKMMAEFFIAGGLTGGLTESLTEGMLNWFKGAMRATTGSWDTALVKYIGKVAVAESRAAIGGATMTLLSPGTLANAAEAAAQLDAFGNVMDFGKAVLGSIADSFIENGTEFGMGPANKAVDVLKKKGLVFDLSKTLNLTPEVRAFLKRSGFHGFMEQYGEEVDGAIIRQLSGLDKNAWKDFTEIDNQLALVTSFGLTIGGGAVVSQAMLGAYKAKADIAGRSLKAAMRSAGYEDSDIDVFMDALYNYDGGRNRPAIVSKVMAQNGSELSEAIVNYLSESAKYRGAVGAREMEQEENRLKKADELLQRYGQDYWTNVTYNDLHGNERTEQRVRVLTDRDGQRFIVTGEAQNGTVAAMNAATGEHVVFDAGTVANQNSFASDKTYSLNEYLDSELIADKELSDEEMIRRQTEAALANVKQHAFEQFEYGPDKVMASPLAGSQTANGVQVAFDRPVIVNGVETDMAFLTWEQLGEAKGTPISAESDVEMQSRIEQNIMNSDRARREVNAKAKGKVISIDGQNVTVVKARRNSTGVMEQNTTMVDVVGRTESGVIKDFIVPYSELQKQLDDLTATMVNDGRDMSVEIGLENTQPPAAPVDNTPRDIKGNPLPLKADGSVDGNALFESDAEAWVAWNDEKYNDGGAASREHLGKAMAREQAAIDALDKANGQTMDQDVIDANNAEKAMHQAQMDMYAALVEEMDLKAQEAERQAADEAMTEEGWNSLMEGLNARINAARTAQNWTAYDAALKEKAETIARYVRLINDGKTLPVEVVTTQDLLGVMMRNGVSQENAYRMASALASTRTNGVEVGGREYILVDGYGNTEGIRKTFNHERQHLLTKRAGLERSLCDDLISDFMQKGQTREEAEKSTRKVLGDIVFKASGSRFYENRDLEELAGEAISFTMERMYEVTPQGREKVFADLGATNEIFKNTINRIDDEQRNDNNLSRSRRRAAADESISGTDTAGETGNEQSVQPESGAVEEQGDGSVAGGEDETLNYRISPEEDAEYLDAVQAGDMNKAQQMVRMAFLRAYPNTKIVDENGLPKEMYHGTGRTFYVFRNTDTANELGAGFYFTDSRKMADWYSNPVNADNVAKIEARAMEIFIDDMGHSEEDAYDNEFVSDYNSAYDRAETELFGSPRVIPVFLNMTAPRLVLDNGVLEEPRGDYDGVVDASFAERHRELLRQAGENYAMQAMVYDANQIKSADTVTYDNDGNVIPLSQRFTESDDIRFQVSEETQRDLEDAGLVIDGGAVMDERARMLKAATGYRTPVERDTDLDVIRFSQTTLPAWASHYKTIPGGEERIVSVLTAWANRTAVDEMVSKVVSQGEYPYRAPKSGKRAKGKDAGPLRTNVEYIITFDMDTTCPRTFQYLNYARAIEQKIGRPMTQTEMVQLIEMMRAYGQMIPCVYCYAENKRQALKQYYADFVAARQGVLNAETEEEALAAMYGHQTGTAALESTDPEVVLTKAAYNVFQNWRELARSGRAYNPTIEVLWRDYNSARNSALTLLDDMLAGAKIKTSETDQSITKKLAKALGISSKEATKVLQEMVSEWKWDAIEGRPHQGFTAVEDEEIFANQDALNLWREMTAYGKSASSAKSVQKYFPYTDELRYISEEDRKTINGMGGLRMHSSNDFRLDYVLDYFQFMADMAANKMYGHTYTKSPEFVRIFGLSGYKINMSIAAYQDKDGKITPNIDEGFDWEEAKWLRQHFPNAGVMLMATSDEQIQMALDEDWIDMFIPFHASGLPTWIWGDMRGWTNYQGNQNEAFYGADTMKAELSAAGIDIPQDITGKALAKFYCEQLGKPYYTITAAGKTKRFKPHFLPGPVTVTTDQGEVAIPGWHTPGNTTAEDTKAYLDLCEQWGVRPRFAGTQVKDQYGDTIDISEHPNYIKCIKETARMDSPQTEIQFNFDQPNPDLGINPATNEAWTPMDWAYDQLKKRAAAVAEQMGGEINDIYENDALDPHGIVDKFLGTYIKHKEETGQDYPIQYLPAEARRDYYLTHKAMEELYGEISPIPYHERVYDEEGNEIEQEKTLDEINEKVLAQQDDQLRGRVTEDVKREFAPRFDEVRNEYERQKEEILGHGGTFTHGEWVEHKDDLVRIGRERDAKLSVLQEEYSRAYEAAEEEEKRNAPKYDTVGEKNAERGQAMFDAAKNEFGTTTNFMEAGYIVPDGEMIDLSGKNDGGEPGRRQNDHRDISSVINDRKYSTATEYMDDFINEGAIRIAPERGLVSLANQPTKEQKERLRSYLYKYSGEGVEVELLNGSRTAAHPTYRPRTAPSRILDDIERYFDQGVVPVGNELMFRVAYHGTGADFDKFDSSHALEGEGAMAHGFGTYVALQEEVGRRYASVLGHAKWAFNGPEGPTRYTRDVVDQIVTDMTRDGEKADPQAMLQRLINNVENLIKKGAPSEYWEGVYAQLPAELEYFKSLKPSDFQFSPQQRNLYTVEIPDDTGDNYLDEDKKVPSEVVEKTNAALMENAVARGKIEAHNAEVGRNEKKDFMGELSGRHGRKFYNRLAEILGERGTYNNQAASELLNSLGIVGIKYDGMMDGECAVIFNEKDLSITDHIRFRAIEITPETRREMDTIAAVAIVDGTYMKAPNGADTKLNDEQWALVRTKAFKAWFGDWENDPENASKVLDENGEPMVLYHGSPETFNTFSPRGIDDNELGDGIYLTDSYDLAKTYTEPNGDNQPLIDSYIDKYLDDNPEASFEEANKWAEENAFVNARVMSLFVNIRKPYNVTEEDFDEEDFRGERNTVSYDRKRAMRDGYDGIIDNTFESRYGEWAKGGNQFVAFSPSQVKSATENNGSFDPNDPDIRYRVTPKQDADYMAAVEAGDMEKAQRMVDEAFKAAYPNNKLVDEKGNPLTYFRGDDDLAERQYREAGHFYSDNREFAEGYGEDVYSVHINSAKPFRGDTNLDEIMPFLDDNWKKIADEVNGEFFTNDYGEVEGGYETKEGLLDALRGNWWIPYEYSYTLKNYLFDQGYDSVALWEDSDNIYVPDYKSNVKLADPVTYDDAGNAIPLSQRFNRESDDIRFRFVGINGLLKAAQTQEEKTAVKDNYNAAKIALRKASTDDDFRRIKLATGWEKGADGKMRYEEPDFAMRLYSEWEKRRGLTLKDIITDETLSQEYPDLADIKVTVKNRGNDYGAFSPSRNEIEINMRHVNDAKKQIANAERAGYTEHSSLDRYLATEEKRLRGTLIHEVQHAIQNREGWARGGSPESYRDPEAAARYAQEKEMYDKVQALSLKAFNDMMSARTDLKIAQSNLAEAQEFLANNEEDSPFMDRERAQEIIEFAPRTIEELEDRIPVLEEAYNTIKQYRSTMKVPAVPAKLGEKGYRALAGEVEARNADRRQDMTDEERRASLATDTEDVVRADQIIRFQVAPAVDNEEELRESQMRFSIVKDQAEIDRLNAGPHKTVYHAMQMLTMPDGKRYLFPPMAAVQGGDYVEGIPVNEDGTIDSQWWEKADERQDLAFMFTKGKKGKKVPADAEIERKDGKWFWNGLEISGEVNEDGEFVPNWYFSLKKGSKGDKGEKLTDLEKVAFDPYQHSGENAVNDQFTTAYDRSHLVIVEARVPLSEYTGESGYKAEKAKLGVGTHPWTGGKLKTDKRRMVTLSRWDNPVRILSDEEVAQDWKKVLDENGLTEVPFNIVTPGQREALIKIGVRIGEPTADNGGQASMDSYNEWKASTMRFRSVEEEVGSSVDLMPVVDQIDAQGFDETLGGSAVNDMYMTIYRDLPDDLRQAVTDDAAANDYDFAGATRRALADLASREDLTPEEEAVLDGAREAMEDTLGQDLRDNDARWLLYEAEHSQDADPLQVARNAVVADRLGWSTRRRQQVEDLDEDLRMRRVQEDEDWAATDYYSTGLNLGAAVKEAHQNMYESLKLLVDGVVKATGKKVQDFENILLAMNQLSSKNFADKDAYMRDFLKPMWDVIRTMMRADDANHRPDKKKRKATMEKIVKYVMLKHGLERNEVFAKRDARSDVWDEYNREVALIDQDQNKTKAQKDADKMAAETTRDARLAEVDAGQGRYYKKHRKDDYSGIMSWFYDQPDLKRRRGESRESFRKRIKDSRTYRYDKLSDAEKEAEVYVDYFEADMGVLTDRLWDRINAATKETLRHQREAGMITQETYDNLSGMFQYYVPLRGFKEDTAEDVYTYYNTKDSSFSAPVLTAKGRRTLADNPFGVIGQMAESGIQADNKNKAKLTLYAFVRNRAGNGLIELKECWYEATGRVNNGQPVFRRVYPEIRPGMTQEEIAQAWADYDADHKVLQAQAPGAFVYGYKGVAAANGVVKMDKASEQEHFVPVMVNGREQVMVVEANPRAAQALNGKLNGEITDNKFKQFAMAWNRLQSALATSLNANFVLTNFVRDMLYSQVSALADHGPKFWAKYNKNWAKVAFNGRTLRLMSNYSGNNRLGLFIEKERPDLVNEYRSFVMNGGPTGYTVLTNNKEYDKKMQKYMNQQLGAEAVRALGAFKERFDDVMESVEQVARFAAYLTAKEVGLSEVQAVNAAKEITLNFNTKGSGKAVTWEDTKQFAQSDNPVWNTLQRAAVWVLTAPAASKPFVMFYNAAVQGLSKFLELLKKAPVVTGGVCTLQFFLGFANAFIHGMGGDPDDDKEVDDYFNIPEFVRRTSYCIGGGKDGHYFRVPIPQELAPFYAMGDMLYTEWCRKTRIEHETDFRTETGKVAELFGELLPFNIATVFTDEDGWMHGMAEMLGRGIAVASTPYSIYTNRTFYGAPIHPENKFRSEEVERASAHWPGSNPDDKDPLMPLYIKVAEWLNSHTGGDDIRAGRINLYPEDIKFVMQDIAGGTGKFWVQVASAMAAVASGEPLPDEDKPILNRFSVDTETKYKDYYYKQQYNWYRYDVFPVYYNWEKGYLDDFLEAHPDVAATANTDAKRRRIDPRTYMPQDILDEPAYQAWLSIRDDVDHNQFKPKNVRDFEAEHGTKYGDDEVVNEIKRKMIRDWVEGLNKYTLK